MSLEIHSDIFAGLISLVQYSFGALSLTYNSVSERRMLFDVLDVFSLTHMTKPSHVSTLQFSSTTCC